MSQSKSTSIIEGFTRMTGGGVIGGQPGPVRPTGFILQDHEGYDWYLWFDTTGDLRTTDAATAEADGFDWDSGGTVVGSQS